MDAGAPPHPGVLVGCATRAQGHAEALSTGERVVDAAADVDTRVVVCHQKPFAEELQALASWIADGRLGEMTRLVGTTKLGRLGQGTHFVHTTNWLLDLTPDSVVGWAHGPGGLDPEPGGHAQPEDAVYELTSPDDTRGFVHNGRAAPDVPEQAGARHLGYRLDVVGTDGPAEYVPGHHAEGIFTDGHERVEARPVDVGSSLPALGTTTDERLARRLSGASPGHRFVVALRRPTAGGRHRESGLAGRPPRGPLGDRAVRRPPA